VKIKCDCGNTNPARFSVVEERTVWLSVDHKDGEFLQPGGNVKEETTNSSRLYCDNCNIDQEIK
jgi:hypothetical protein